MKFRFLSNQPEGGLDFVYQPTKQFAKEKGIVIGPLAKEVDLGDGRFEFRTYYGGAVIADMSEVIPLTDKCERSFRYEL